MKKVAIIVSALFLFACSKKEVAKKQPLNFDLTGEVQQVNVQTVVQDPANQSNFISVVDSVNKYGFGYKIIIPDSLKGHNLKVIYSGDIKETESLTGEIILSVHEQNMNTLFWSSQNISKITKDINKWTPFKDSLMIFADKNPKSAMYLYMFNQKLSGKGILCVDNLKVKIYKD